MQAQRTPAQDRTQTAPLRLYAASCIATCAALLCVLSALSASTALAEGSPYHGPKLGGHIGLGTPLATVGTVDPSYIGRDSAVLGIIAGINLGLSESWAINFEFIALSNFKDASSEASATTFVLDPGVVYNWGPLWTGLRMAMRVPAPLGGAELGFVPIIGTAWKVSEAVAYYIELDLPTFIHAPSDVTLTAFVQTGFGF